MIQLKVSLLQPPDWLLTDRNGGETSETSETSKSREGAASFCSLLECDDSSASCLLHPK